MKPLRIFICLLLLGWSQYAAPARADGSVPRPPADRIHQVINQIANQLDAARFDSAQFYLNQGVRLLSQRADAESAFYLSAYQSEVFYHNALFEQGIQYALRGLHQAESLRDSTMMANQHNLLGLFYTDLGQTAKAIAHLQRSIQLLPKRPASRYGLTNRYHILSNLGQCYHKTGQYDRAISFNNQSFRAADRAVSLRGMSVAAWALGNDYAAQQKTNSADYWYRESIRRALLAADYDAAILNYPALFTLHHPRQPALALKYLAEGVRQMETQQARISTYIKRLFTEQQTAIYFQLGQYRRAVESHRLLERINREIAEKEKQQRLYMLQAYYENERQQLRQQAAERMRQGELRRNRQVALAAGGVAVLLLIALVAVYYGYRQKQKIKDLLQQQRIRELEQKQEITTLKAMMTGEERERVRIARELHDGLSGLLAAARYQVEGYFRATKTSPDTTAPLSLLDEASREVRRISHNLMPYALQQHGFVGALREYTSSLNGPETPQLQFMPTGPDPALPATAELWLYRCAQELIGNALRHAHATIISVRLQTEPDQFCLSVTDNGRGFNPDRAYDGNGLRNIRMRLSHLGGQLSVQSDPAQGSILSLYLPLTVTPPTA